MKNTPNKNKTLTVEPDEQDATVTLQADDNGASEANKQADSSISSDLIRGHINTIILTTLSDGDKYGYEIIKDIETKSNGQYTLKQPTLYSALKRLESLGYVTSFWGGVSNGGRRRYFKLTDEGKAIAEQNQSEWEYSRTVIDNLISTKQYDLSAPSPAPLDMSILKQATTRAPFRRHDGVIENADALPHPSSVEDLNQQSLKEMHAEQDAPLHSDADLRRARAEQIARQEALYRQAQTEEQKRQIHENFIKLIKNEDEGASKPTEPIWDVTEAQTARSTLESTSSQDLMYNAKPSTERDYKDIIGKLFSRSIKEDLTFAAAQDLKADEDNLQQRQSLQDEYEKEITEKQKSQNTPLFATSRRTEQAKRNDETMADEAYARAKAGYKIDYYDVFDKADREGIRVNVSNNAPQANVRSKVGTSEKYVNSSANFNKGKALFASALAVFAILCIEILALFLVKDRLGISVEYPVDLLYINLSFFAVFMLIYGLGLFSSSRRKKYKNLVSNSILATVLVLFAIIGISIACGIEYSNVTKLFEYVIIPAVLALNIPVFFAVYKSRATK